jgi:hypothetical protein
LTFKYKSEVIGKNGISARVVAKSKSAYSDTILTCWEYDAPKCILAELNTHGILVRNAQSSRAVPVTKVIEQIRNNPVTPVHWGANQAGMVAGDEINNPVKVPRLRNTVVYHEVLPRDVAWKEWADVNSLYAEGFDEAGYHKQVPNRPMEAFTMVRGVISGTEIDNFFHLRYHPDADPYIQELARCMWEAYELAETEVLYDGEWHVPYVKTTREPEFNRRLYFQEVDPSKTGYGLHVVEDGIFYKEITVEEALKISAAACGQISYRKLDLSEETVDRVWDRLMTGDIIHASVTGHQAMPMKWPQRSGFSWEKGITHLDREGELWSAQFKHWIMYRKLIPNESFKGKFVPPTKNKSES